MRMPTIKAKGFILRPFKKGDETSIVKNINNKKIAKATLSILYPYSKKDAVSWIGKNLKFYKQLKPKQINLAISIDDEIVGGIGLTDINGHKAEIGYWLGENYWGRGIATAAAELITEYAFSRLGLKRIYAYVFAFNKASARVLEKAGFIYEGKLRKNVIKDGKPMDDLLFARVK